MIFSSAFTAYALGLRHGADPDHLAAIDNLTRNSIEQRPSLSRFVGTLFAGGHTIMVLAIAALVGFLGSRFAAHSAEIETIGTWISIIVLLLLACMNLRQLAVGRTDRVAGVKTRLLPAALRGGTSPWLAVPVGLLFGFGFETSSQIATYAIAFGADGGVLAALIVGSMFCFGMVCTDTLDSVMVHRLVVYRSGHLPRVMRLWIASVTILAFAVAGYELLQVIGVRLPLSDLALSASLVTALLAVFGWIFLSTRSPHGRATAVMEHTP
jgi:high-affinity nickel-transport protein